MSKRKSKHEDATKGLMGLLVSNTLKKHGIENTAMKLSDKEKQELRKTVKKLKKQADSFLKNLHKNVTETTVTSAVPPAADPDQSGDAVAAAETVENDVNSLKIFNKDQ
ncbi:hypothetical protein [Peribacillus kribbensis]|uniref:hypothetical protein n=1 Tax=Peribacillus kribbensis TaxID=356658 RepID=UPI0003F53B46|nr:hypothetical protein [Peribacillus kribbensis]